MLDIFSILLSVVSDQNSTNGLCKEDRFMLFLMKLKLGVSYCVLGTILGINASAASKIFISVLNEVYFQTREWIHWPSQQAVRATNPPSFKNYPRCRAILDCTEYKTEKPPGVEAQVKMYSSYKGTFTIKVLVCITPSGLISFLSCGYGGRASDPFITNNCGILSKFEPGDVILADKGFPNIQVNDGTVVVMPPFASKLRSQFS